LRSASYSLAIVALAFASMGGDCTLGGGPISVAPKICTRAAPVMIQAEAGCGPGGPIVVQGSSMYPQYPSLIEISNSHAVGLPPTSADSCDWIWGYANGSVNGDGGGCQIRWDEGTWMFAAYELVGADGSLKHGDCSTGGRVTLETCSAGLGNGGGSLTCQPSDGGAPCTSRLTAVGDGGAD
jgi:hypothetical protein